MKKIYFLPILFSLMCLGANATVHVINVEDNEYNPSSVTVTVGDTIRWMWDNSAGDHTTTSTNIPSGAMSWDSPINSSNQVFNYLVTVAGSYNYHCTIHSNMDGSFTATGGSTMVNPVETAFDFSLNSWVSAATLNYNFNLPVPAYVNLNLYNILGNHVTSLGNHYFGAGRFSSSVSVADLPKGIYFIELNCYSGRLVQRFVIH